MNNIKEQVAKILLDIKAVTLRPKNPFRYTSGILSPIYTDCRLIISYPKLRKITKDLYLKSIGDSRVEFDIVAGTSTAGIPWAALIADSLNLPMVYVRSSAKDHGKKNKIEGLVKKGQTSIVVEDLISTGKSSVETANAIRGNGAKVSHVFSIMTYQLKNSKNLFNQNSLELISLTNLQSVVEAAQKFNYINPNDQELILTWIKDPDSWGKKMGFEV